MTWDEVLSTPKDTLASTLAKANEALRTELKNKQAKLDRATKLEDENVELRRQLAATQKALEALRPKPDAWEPRLREFIRNLPKDEDELSTEYLLSVAVRVPDTTNPAYGRRLAKVMRAIGGWRHSTNVREIDGALVRGWKKILDCK